MSTEKTGTAARARRASRAVAALAAVIAAVAVTASSASAAPEFAEYVVGSSDTQAGGHPDLNVVMRLENAADPEVVRDLTFNLPQGVFGNPGAIYKCEAADFAINQCQPGSQAGIVKIVSNYEGVPEHDPRHRSGLQHADDRRRRNRAPVLRGASGQHPDRGPGFGPQRLGLRPPDVRAEHLADGGAEFGRIH